MRRTLLKVLLGSLIIGLAAWPALAWEVTTKPAKTATLQDVHQLALKAEAWARWGCILAGLALLGVIWMDRRSLQTVLKNQVDLARLLRGGKQD